MQAIRAVEAVLHTQDNEARRSFIEDHLEPDYVASIGEDAMLEHLADLSAIVANADGLDVERTPTGVRMKYGGVTSTDIGVEFVDGSAGLISSIAILSQRIGGPGPEIERRVQAVEGLGRASSDEALKAFAEEHLAPNFRASLRSDQLMQLLRDIHGIAATAGGISIEGSPEGIRVGFRGAQNADVLIQIDDQSPHFITSLKLETDIEDAEGMQVEPIGWGNLEGRLAEEEAAGFAGAVLVLRDGDVVLDRGFGLANRAEDLPNTSETIFDIGSTPIDFTRAAVLKLVDTGALSLDDPISRYISDTPTDKAGITIDQLMTGRSGLPNFHHIPGVDEDYDLSYIDREEAIRRMLSQPLLFEPGTEQAHSHSAFGLMAAIVELVSGASYGDFLSEQFFEPAGMTRTGFYGDVGFSEDDYAVGYGSSNVGRINIPLFWGPASWLVMGSGGMVSNPSDLRRFVEFICDGGLSEGSKETFFLNQLLAGGTDRGFFCMYSDVAETTFFLCSNSHEREGDHTLAVARALAEMVRAGG